MLHYQKLFQRMVEGVLVIKKCQKITKILAVGYNLFPTQGGVTFCPTPLQKKEASSGFSITFHSSQSCIVLVLCLYCHSAAPFAFSCNALYTSIPLSVNRYF